MENLSVKKVVVGIVILVVVTFSLIFLAGVLDGFTAVINK